MTDLISSHPDILGGKPVISGTRISVELIFELIGSGVTVDEILIDYYPHLSRDILVQVLKIGIIAQENQISEKIKEKLLSEISIDKF